MEHTLELYNADNELIAWVNSDGTVGGEAAEDITVTTEAPVIDESTVTPITGTVKVYYDGTSWTKIASYYDGEEYTWKDFNGAYVLNRDYQFNLKFKDTNNTESSVYKVLTKGSFIFHQNGQWEKIEDNGNLPPYVAPTE